MLFGPDSTLYVMVGDRDRLCCTGTEDNSLRMKAQALDNHVGKTLRLRDDGGVPTDNPFVGKAGAKPEIFTYGHRNGYGLAFHPETGELWQAEIGPLGGDEVNILIAGHNYGWPLVSTGRNYTGTLVSDQPWSRPGMDNPRIHWVPSISPSSIMFYTGDKFPQWKNSLFVGALTTRQLQRISFNQPSQAERREALLLPLNIRPRDVQQSPDGYIYVATEGVSRGDMSDGTVLRIEPELVRQSAVGIRTSAVHTSICSSCNEIGIPLAALQRAWNPNNNPTPSLKPASGSDKSISVLARRGRRLPIRRVADAEAALDEVNELDPDRARAEPSWQPSSPRWRLIPDDWDRMAAIDRGAVEDRFADVSGADPISIEDQDSGALRLFAEEHATSGSHRGTVDRRRSHHRCRCGVRVAVAAKSGVAALAADRRSPCPLSPRRRRR